MAGCAPQARTVPGPVDRGAEVSAVERVVQAQVEAYNRHELEAFAATYASDVRFYAFPDSLISSGRDALRRDFGQLFTNAPKLHATILTRVVQGNFVIDQELVTGLPNGGTLTGIVIYEVKNAQITRVWFML